MSNDYTPYLSPPVTLDPDVVDRVARLLGHNTEEEYEEPEDDTESEDTEDEEDE